jgi:uncharacterized protein YkwD
VRNMLCFLCPRSLGALGIAALVVLLCFFPSEITAQGPQRSSAISLEAQTHGSINAHRRAEGLSPLEYDSRIASTARRHSAAMAAGKVPIGHEGFEVRRHRIEETIPLRGMAENVGVNDYPADRTVAAAVSKWLASTGHRENIEGDYDVTGIGIARGPQGVWFYTQIFVKRERSRTAMPGILPKGIRLRPDSCDPGPAPFIFPVTFSG